MVWNVRVRVSNRQLSIDNMFSYMDLFECTISMLMSFFTARVYVCMKIFFTDGVKDDPSAALELTGNH